MKTLLTCVLLTLVLFISETDCQFVDPLNWRMFDCTRGPAPYCSGQGTCRSSDGVCICNNNRLGFDCSLDGLNGAFITGQCNRQCLNGASCYRNNFGQDTCFCSAAYVGASCSIHRASMQCFTNQTMIIQVYPQRPSTAFTGILSTQAINTLVVSTDPRCRAVTNPLGAWDGQRFRLTIDSSGSQTNPCLPARQIRNTVNGNQVCMTTRLQYSRFYQAAVDERFLFCCTETTDIGDGITNVGNGNSNDRGAQVTGQVNILDSRMIFTTSTRLILPTDTLSVGQLISFVVYFNGAGSRYTDLRLITCVANPGNIALISQRCPADPALVANLRKVGNEVFVDLNTWLPTGSNRINISCTAVACEQSCGAVTSCPQSTIQNFGRKRRQADASDGEQEYAQTSQSFTVSSMSDSPGSCPIQEPCPSSVDVNTVFVPVAVVFGGLLLVVLGFSIFLCFKLRNKGKTIPNPDPQVY